MSDQIDARLFKINLTGLLDETVYGVDEAASGSRYLDRNAGWLPTLSGLDAKAASTPAFPGATTVVAQLRHTIYYFEIVLAFSRGEEPSMDWPGSFEPTSATDGEFAALTGRLEAVTEELRAAAEGAGPWTDDRVGDYMSILVHTAYHLGSLRQLIRAAAGLSSAA